MSGLPEPGDSFEIDLAVEGGGRVQVRAVVTNAPDAQHVTLAWPAERLITPRDTTVVVASSSTTRPLSALDLSTYQRKADQ